MDCDSDHILLTGKLRMKAYKKIKMKNPTKFYPNKFKGPEIINAFKIETKQSLSGFTRRMFSNWKATQKKNNGTNM